MIKVMDTDKSPVKKTIKIALLILLAPIVLFLLISLWYLVTNPILDKFDHDKFNRLDTSMQGVFQKLKTTSNGTDEWKYAAVCSADRSGWMKTGKYNCITSISTQKTITSVQELNDLQTKYYSLIDNSGTLAQKTELDPELPDDFGKNFVVSSAFKDYTELKSGIECTYLIKLYQNDRNLGLSFDTYGSDIQHGLGGVFVSLRCSGITRSHWYPLSETADLIIP